ncbi:MAG: DUF3040 domain-containing protein [Sciscionella sp.]
MALTADEQRQLREIGGELAADDPKLVNQLSRMAPYSMESRDMAIGALAVLAVGSGMFFLLGTAYGRPLCTLAGALCAAAALIGTGGWWLAHRTRRHRMAIRTGPNHESPPTTGRARP